MIPRPPAPATDRATAASLRLDRRLDPAALGHLMERAGGGALTLLESAGPPGRWSLLASHPTARFVSRAGANRFHWHSRGVSHAWREPPLAALRRTLAAFPRVDSDPALPIHGGALGLFAHELGRRLLPLHPLAEDDLGLPDIALYFHERLLAVDRESGEAYALATARGPSEAAARRESRARAALLAEEVQALLEVQAAPHGDPPARAAAAEPAAVDREPIASLEHRAYLAAVARCREAILDGEAYELCLTTRFAAPFAGDPVALYRRLRAMNPAPYASFFRHPEGVLVGASPERFLRVTPERPGRGAADQGHPPAGAG